jgi:hypothetical protein
MKGLWYLILLFFIQETHAQYNVIKADVVPIFVTDPRVFRPSYERSIGKYLSGLITFETGRYGYADTADITKLQDKLQVMEVRGWGILPALRVYPFGKKSAAPLGFFVGPHFLYRSLNEHYAYGALDISSHAQQKGFGLNAGYKFAFLNRVCVDLLVGYTKGSGTWTSSDGDRSLIAPRYRYDVSNVKNFLRFEVSVGFFFPKVNANIHTIEEKKKLKEYAVDLEDSDTSYGQLIIYRPRSFEGETVEYDLFINDSLVSHMKSGSYHTYEVLKDGKYTISATTEDSVSAEIDLKKGKIYYLECTVGAGTAVGLPKFRLVPEKKAEAKINKILEEKK